MGFKEDADFARFLTMGAHGTAAVAADLNSRGHEIIELERYAMANKVWSIKVKRLRVPDLLCIRCGRRFESKAKSKLEIKLSHSATQDREWFAGGMRPSDVFAFVRVVLDGDQVTIGRPYYFTRTALEDAFGSVKAGVRKAISAGSEADVSWPAWVPGYDGVFLGLSSDDPRAFRAQKLAGGSATYRAPESWVSSYPYLNDGADFVGKSDLVAGSVSPAATDCAGDVWDWSSDLESPEQSDRFAAVKSCGRRTLTLPTIDLLATIASDQDEDWRVRLEAQGALAVQSPEDWLSPIEATATDVELPPEQQMEAVFVLTELTVSGAKDALQRTAKPEPQRPSEVRSAAVWGLGVGSNCQPAVVAAFVDDPDDRVALHAASALPDKLPPDVITQLRGWLSVGTERQSAVAATLLARHGRYHDLLEMTERGHTRGRLYALRALGQVEQGTIEGALGALLNAEALSSLEPMWTQHTDWMWRVENQGALDVLDMQQVQHFLKPDEYPDND